MKICHRYSVVFLVLLVLVSSTFAGGVAPVDSRVELLWASFRNIFGSDSTPTFYERLMLFGETESVTDEDMILRKMEEMFDESRAKVDCIWDSEYKSLQDKKVEIAKSGSTLAENIVEYSGIARKTYSLYLFSIRNKLGKLNVPDIGLTSYSIKKNGDGKIATVNFDEFIVEIAVVPEADFAFSKDLVGTVVQKITKNGQVVYPFKWNELTRADFEKVHYRFVEMTESVCIE